MKKYLFVTVNFLPNIRICILLGVVHQEMVNEVYVAHQHPLAADALDLELVEYHEFALLELARLDEFVVHG